MKKVEQTILLANGVELPLVGFGTFRILEPEIGTNAIKEAIETGYQLLDTAEHYHNHHLVAEAIKQSSKKRSDLFITSKLWPNEENPENLRNRLYKMLAELETDYLDLILVHWPLPYGLEAYQALEDFYLEGHAKAIGVSNFNVEQLKNLLKVCRIKPMVNQIELHPHANRQDIVNFAKENGIAITSWQTMMDGKVGDLPYLQELATKYAVDPAAIALSWAVQQQICVIPKAINPKHLKDNFHHLDYFNLNDEEINKINLLTKIDGQKMNSEEFLASEKL
ncbi:diketogulonate reductase-like aldo/keto reductase [Entomoplasma freundtii]|uniref:Aldo/keto reductase n=1 Tax=Entomoplasma freundtii TaxID=74700 RepID=A0A2K8NS12_9MOLU|nr:aldo/keto reductase [Entomoplasma freundtii]ATZ16599.1 aldo/keto reductase [Entomoplasma freundtii]TDY58235.1 diketogulonate reductase-like aldo/keto reductase [Entomoplasma freundtii]